MRCSSGAQDGPGSDAGAAGSGRADCGMGVTIAGTGGAGRATGRCVTVALAPFSGVGAGWRGMLVGSATVAGFGAPIPAMMLGIESVGSGRSGTAETRAAAGFFATGTVFPVAATLVRAGGIRRAASQRARSVLPRPRRARSTGAPDDPATRHSAGAQRRTMSRADL